MKMKSAEKLDRKTVEKNRRIHMRNLCFKLTSVIPRQHLKNPPKEVLSLPDQLAQAGNYIQHLKERVEELKRRKQLALSNNETTTNSNGSLTVSGIKYPRFEFRDLGSGLEIVLVTGIIKKFKFSKVISILIEGGAEVVTASVSTIGDKVFHTLHAQVKVSRVGVDTSRVCERLRELIR